MARPVNRALLASAIEYAAQDKLTDLEWNRFFVQHYHDELMEDARRETVRILQPHPSRESLAREARARLDELARVLRQGQSART